MGSLCQFYHVQPHILWLIINNTDIYFKLPYPEMKRLVSMVAKEKQCSLQKT